MRIYKHEKVMRVLQVSWPVLLLLIPFTAASLCTRRHQFWDATLESCVDCTKCNRTREVVLRPCQVHQDTICGPVSALNIDWSWLNPHSHKQHPASRSKHQHHHRKHSSDASEEVVLSFGEDVTSHRKHVAEDGDRLLAARRDNRHTSKDRTPQVRSKTKHSNEKVLNSSWASFEHHKHAAGESFSAVEGHKLHWTSAEAIALMSHQPSSNRRTHERKHKKHDRQHVMWSSEGAESEDQAMRVIEQELRSSSSSSSSSNSEGFETSKHSHHHDSKQHNKTKHPHQRKTVPTPESASQLKVPNVSSSVLSLGRVPTHEEYSDNERRSKEGAVSPEPFSATESLIWDGQAVILALAVFACLLFFLVAAIYSIHHARQWTRLKENFEADVEELSARLSLMPPGTDNVTTSEGCNTNTNLQCVYLEQLLVRKQQEEAGKERGNVYIDRDVNIKSSK